MIRLGIIMDSLESLNIKKDTTLALMEAAQRRNWRVDVIYQKNLILAEGAVTAIGREVRLNLKSDPWFCSSEPVINPLSDYDCILMRKDPPFNMEYIYATYMLDRAEAVGVLVVNRPHTLRDCNEKLYATRFPQCCPPLLVSANADELKNFYREHGDVIYKPLDGMGGNSILRARENEPNLSVMIELLTNSGETPIMAQKYIPEILQGDKRILMIDGAPVEHCLARIPREGETRGNLAAGGRGEVRPLTERDRWIATEVGPDLRERGVIFAGLDVIGDYLTEINITSPTCVREIDAGAGIDIGSKLMDAIEVRLNEHERNPG